MAKINARELDPQRYSCIQTEQQELKSSIPAILQWRECARIARTNWRSCVKEITVQFM